MLRMFAQFWEFLENVATFREIFENFGDFLKCWKTIEKNCKFLEKFWKFRKTKLLEKFGNS